MKVLAFSIFIFLFPFLSVAQTDGEKIFSTVCVACHTIGSGRLVGPDLKDVDKKQSDKWIKSFIKSSQKVITGGDKTATALFAEYNNIVMPDQPDFTDAQLSSIIAYIKSKGTPKEVAKADTAATPATATTTPPASTNVGSGNTPPTTSNTPTINPIQDKNTGSDSFALFTNGIFWVITGVFILMLFVIFALSKTIISLTKIIPNTKD